MDSDVVVETNSEGYKGYDVYYLLSTLAVLSALVGEDMSRVGDS